MAGQVDVIISKQAIAEIQVATAQLEQLRIKILQVNKAGAKGTIGGIGNNKDVTEQLSKLNQLVTANNKLTTAANKRLTSINRNTKAMDRSTASTKRATKGIKLMQTALASISITMLAMKLLQFGKDIFTLAKTFDSLGFAIIKTSKTLNEAAMNTRFMLSLSKDLGLSLVATTTRFIKFAAAANNSGMAMKDTQKIFKTMAKAGSVLGLRVDELGGVFLALEQMLSKGKVTTEELRRQLGERLPGAFGIMAASLNVTLPQLDKMLKAGEILSADVLPGFADAVEIAFGLETVDKIDTMVAAQNRSTTAWENFVKGITGADSVIQNTFKSILDGLANFYNGMNMMHNEEIAMAHLRTSNAFDQQEHDIKANSIIVLDSRRKEGQKLADLDKEILDAKADLEKNINSDAADERLRLAVADKIQFNKELAKIEQEDAALQFARRFADVQEQQAIVDSIKKTDAGATDKFGNSIAYYTKEDVILLEKATEELQKRQGILDATRLIGEKSKVADKAEDDDGTGRGKKPRFVGFADPGSLDDLKRMIKLNEEIIGQTSDIDQRNRLSAENVLIQEQVDKLQGMLDLLHKGDFSMLDNIDFDDFADDTELMKQGIVDFADALKMDGQAALAEFLEDNELTIENIIIFYDLLEKRAKKLTEAQIEQLEINLEFAGKYADAISDIGNALFDRKIAQIDEEIRKEEEKYAMLFALAEGDDEQQRLLSIQQEEDRAKLEKKRRKALKEQAVFNKASALVDIAINTAIAISRAPVDGLIFGLAAVPVIAALGALQAAAVLAQPLPAFAEGGIMTHDGPALLGDGGKTEVVRNPDGSLFLTPSTDTVMNLQKGAEVFSSIDKFNSANPSSLEGALHSASLLASISLSQKNIDGLLSSQRELDERLLQEMIKNTKAVKNSKSNTFVKTQSIDIPHEIWKNKYLS